MSQTARTPAHRLTEIIAVLLLGVATVGTAWCGYQSSSFGFTACVSTGRSSVTVTTSPCVWSAAISCSTCSSDVAVNDSNSVSPDGVSTTAT